MILQPLDTDTRIRGDHNTAGTILDYVNPVDRITGIEIFTAPVDFTYEGKVIQFAGDRWLKVEYVNSVPASGWIAITHKADSICREIPQSEPVPDNFPHTFRLTNLQTGEYKDYERIDDV